MGKLTLVLAAISCLALKPVAAAASVDRWSAFISEASVRFGIPEPWIRRVMRAESGGHTMLGGRPITSHAGAMGLMQLMPATWSAMRTRLGLGQDPHDPRDNILAGTAYLRAMYNRFGYPGLFAAYNAGPGRYAAHLAGRRGLPAETRAYVAAIAGARPSRAPSFVDASAIPVDPPPARPALRTMFVVGGQARAPEAPPPARQPASTGLFYELRGSR